MIIEFTSGQFIISIGIVLGIIAAFNFLLGLKDVYKDVELITGIFLGIFAIIIVIIGLNVEYGFLVFKLVNE